MKQSGRFSVSCATLWDHPIFVFPLFLIENPDAMSFVFAANGLPKKRNKKEIGNNTKLFAFLKEAVAE